MNNTALLGNTGDMAVFEFNDVLIRFKVSKALKAFKKILLWDNGYIEVIADYGEQGETEEYIDLIPILINLYMEPDVFLKDIAEVKIKNE
ncbi:MAG: hypothetical protein IJL89_03210 [Firmicutes bacterium]|nr:hypothetical protein [Bacillota bacterium]